MNKQSTSELSNDAIHQVRVINGKWYKNLSFYFTIAAIVISILSLLISLGIQNKFKPYAKIGGLYLFAPAKKSSQALMFYMPISIINKGDKSGIIESIYCLVKYKTTELKYEPQFESDISNYKSSKAVGLSNMGTVFIPFGLNDRESMIKFYFFTPPMQAKQTTMLPMQSGNYKIQLYIKTSDKDDYVLLDSKDFFIEESIVQRYQKGRIQ